MAKPPTIVDLTWRHDLAFEVVADSSHTLTIDSGGRAGLSPMQALGTALAGCMTIDVAHILTRGRHGFRALRSRLIGERAQDEPHRFVRVTLHVIVEGSVPREAVARALQLSHDKYCSVWHSMRQDIEFAVTFDLIP